MPFYWSQRPNLKYKPKPIISKTTNHVRAHNWLTSLCAFSNEHVNPGANPWIFAQMDGFQRHFDSQLLIYGKQTILNLVRTHIKALSHLCWIGIIHLCVSGVVR